MMYYMLAAKILAKINLHGGTYKMHHNLLYYRFYSLNLGRKTVQSTILDQHLPHPLVQFLLQTGAKFVSKHLN